MRQGRDEQGAPGPAHTHVTFPKAMVTIHTLPTKLQSGALNPAVFWSEVPSSIFSEVLFSV